MLTLSKNYASCEQRRVPIPPLQGEFPRVLQIYVSFFSKIAPLASGVRLKTRFGDGPGALADSYAVENPNVDFEDLSHTSQRTKSCLQPSRRCGIIALPESQHGNSGSAIMPQRREGCKHDFVR